MLKTISVVTAQNCGNGQQRCEFPDYSATPIRQTCSGNTWGNDECCSKCSVETLGEATCNDASAPNAEGKCPSLDVGAVCENVRQCTGYLDGGIDCIHKKCVKSYGAKCMSNSDCVSPYSDGEIVCTQGICSIPEGGNCYNFARFCPDDTSCIDQRCQRFEGARCTPGKTKCALNNVCSPQSNKCVGRLGGICSRLCDQQPSGLGPNTTVRCINNPLNSDRFNRCLPVLPKGAKCVSEKDCLRGPCENGVCTAGTLGKNETCVPNDSACSSELTCISSFNLAESRCVIGPGNPCDPIKDFCHGRRRSELPRCFDDANGTFQCRYSIGSPCSSDNCDQSSAGPGMVVKCLKRDKSDPPPDHRGELGHRFGYDHVPIFSPGAPGGVDYGDRICKKVSERSDAAMMASMDS